jgi:hypothetical protein
MPKTDPEVSKTYGSGSGWGTMLITLTGDDVSFEGVKQFRELEEEMAVNFA